MSQRLEQAEQRIVFEEMLLAVRQVQERIERLEEDKAAVQSDLKEVYAEAKGNGFDAKALRTIVRLRKMDTDERREQEEILETYLHALGMVQ